MTTSLIWPIGVNLTKYGSTSHVPRNSELGQKKNPSILGGSTSIKKACFAELGHKKCEHVSEMEYV